jgi:hypothetical protein
VAAANTVENGITVHVHEHDAASTKHFGYRPDEHAVPVAQHWVHADAGNSNPGCATDFR